MKRYLLLMPFILSGCTLSEIQQIEKDPLSLFQKKVEMDKRTHNGILVHKKALGSKFICYYNYVDADDDSVSGYSIVRETCPGGITVNRK